jgi:hypothetical protein
MGIFPEELLSQSEPELLPSQGSPDQPTEPEALDLDQPGKQDTLGEKSKGAAAEAERVKKSKAKSKKEVKEEQGGQEDEEEEKQEREKAEGENRQKGKEETGLKRNCQVKKSGRGKKG